VRPLRRIKTISHIDGDLRGIKTSLRKGLERTYRRRVAPREVVSPELARHLVDLSRELNRQVGVLIARDGTIRNVIVGDATTLHLPDIGRLRGGGADAGRLLLDELGLPHDRLAGALSSGMLQRLRWAGALLHRPPILLLDEPLQNLDRQGRHDVLGLLERHLESGLAVVANPDRLDIGHVARHLDLDG